MIKTLFQTAMETLTASMGVLWVCFCYDIFNAVVIWVLFFSCLVTVGLVDLWSFDVFADI